MRVRSGRPTGTHSRANKRPDLKLAGAESAQESIQQELVGLKLLFGDEPGEDMQERGMFLGDQLWPSVFTERYSNWVDLEGGLSDILP